MASVSNEMEGSTSGAAVSPCEGRDLKRQQLGRVESEL